MDLVSRASLLFGASPAVMSAAKTFSFRNCSAMTSRIACSLYRKGLRSGSTVAMLSPNTPESVLMVMALQRTGLVCAPLNHRFPSESLHASLSALQPDLLLASDPSLIPRSCQVATASLPEMAAPVSGSEPVRFTPSENSMDRPLTIMHTSASSGTPKAALHSFANHWYNALGAAGNMPLQAGDCWLLSLPLFHVGGYAVLFRSLVSGSTVAVPELHETVEKSLERFPVTHLSLVPTQLYRLLRNPAALPKLRKLKALLLGGSAVPGTLLEKCIREGIPAYLSYGTTEMCSQIATTSEPVCSTLNNSGSLLPFRELRIADDGEILVKGACLFQGYLREGKLFLPLDKEGWFHTGDTGNLDNSSTLHVTGRKDNMFISGGENLHPEEIEQVLAEIEGIEQAVVVPVADHEYGCKPAAFLKTAVPGIPDDSSISDAVTKKIGKLKTPLRYIRVCQWATLPGSQKIDRKWYKQLVLTDPLQPDASA